MADAESLFLFLGVTVHQWAVYIAFVSVTVAIVLSVHLIFMHLQNYHRPDLQLHVVRVLWMVPIYALDSWIGLKFKPVAVYADVLRDTYEAFTVYSFLKFLLGAMGGESQCIRAMARTKQVNMLVPCCCLQPWVNGEELFENCKNGVLQYVIVKPVCTVLIGAVVAGVDDHLEPLVFMAANLSQMWALYCLAMFYLGTHEELARWKPFSKFLCVKSVVFFTFWQGIALAWLQTSGIIQSVGNFTPDEIVYCSQDFLVCVEMAIIAVIHRRVFSASEFQPEGADDLEEMPITSAWSVVKESLIFKDWVDEVRGFDADRVRSGLRYGTFRGKEGGRKEGEEEDEEAGADGGSRARARWQRGVSAVLGRLHRDGGDGAGGGAGPEADAARAPAAAAGEARAP